MHWRFPNLGEARARATPKVYAYATRQTVQYVTIKISLFVANRPSD